MVDLPEDQSDDDRYEQIDPEEGWDTELAEDLVGSTLYVAFTFVDHDNQSIKREQVFGRVVSVSISGGIRLKLADGEMFTMAPVLAAIEPGDRGYYRFTEDDEAIENPDFVAWITAIEPLRN